MGLSLAMTLGCPIVKYSIERRAVTWSWRTPYRTAANTQISRIRNHSKDVRQSLDGEARRRQGARQPYSPPHQSPIARSRLRRRRLRHTCASDGGLAPTAGSVHKESRAPVRPSCHSMAKRASRGCSRVRRGCTARRQRSRGHKSRLSPRAHPSEIGGAAAAGPVHHLQGRRPRRRSMAAGSDVGPGGSATG